MEYPSNEYKSFLVIPHTFSAIRVFEDEEKITHMSATAITLKISCSPIDDGTMTPKEMGQKAIIGFQRLRAWLEAVLNNIIIIDAGSPIMEMMRKQVANLMLFTPGAADDSLLAVMFHSKAKSITADLMEIHSIIIASTDTENTERYYRCLDGNYELPGIEYYNDLPMNKDFIAINDIPWWERQTIDICEYARLDNDDEQIICFETDPLSEIGKEYLINDEEADIIVFDAWKKDKDKDKE